MAKKEKSGEGARAPGPELRLVDRRAYVGFPELQLAPGVVLSDFALSIPDVTFPLNVSGGATRYQKKKLDFGFLELSIDAEVIQRKVTEIAGRLKDLSELKLYFRPGFLEAQARLAGPERTPVTFKVAFDGDGDALAVYFYDVRFYAYSTTPACRLPALVAEAVEELGILPETERRGANGFVAHVLEGIVEQAAVGRGYKMPTLDQARLAEASVTSKGLRLRFSSGGLPPPAPPDEELLLALEGARAFADAEEAVARGDLKAAKAAYLKLGDATEAHPFAVERLLTLLVADPQSQELALDIAASLAKRREKSATALWAEAVVRERRGEFARASERYLALCTLARRAQEEAAAFFAAEAGARASREHAPQMAVKALHELLGLKPDHLPSLKALARASDQAQDRAGAIRAYRRLAALARDSADAADAHVQLARLCAITEDDIAGARLHCEAALRLSPDHPDALLQLGELCFKGGEHLRAIKALDRLREVAMGRHEVDRVGRANLLAGQVWEAGLKQPENALLRYREASSLLPGEARPLYLAARVADALGRVQEAVAGYQQAIELAGPAPRDEEVRLAAHASHHALARLLKTKLGEPARAKEHLEAALALDPADTAALDELLPYFRASGRSAELADACEKAAAVSEDPTRKAALWAEAGELYRGRLGQPEKAERLLEQAAEADPKNRMALEGLLALAEARRDGQQLARCLKSLVEVADDPKERVRHARRLAVAARDLAFDLDLAVHAYREVLKVEPDDLPVLGELTQLERRRADMAGLAWALEQRARAAENLGDKRLAAAALRELGQVLDLRLGRPGDALVALEKAARLFPEPNALLELATLSLRLERALNARRALEDVLALLPKHAPPERVAEVRARLGRACELLDDKDAARENYAMAFPLRRLDDELAGRLEALYEEAGSQRELTDLWNARAQALLAAQRPHEAAPLFYKSAEALLAQGDRAGAMLRLSAALDAAPSGEKAAEVLEAMARLEVERNEPAEAARLMARRAQLEPEPRAAARLLKKAAQLVRNTPRELQYLNQALEKDGTFAPSRLRRAELTEASAPRDAFADLEVVLAADPEDVDVKTLDVDKPGLSRRAGFAALKAGQFDAARRLLSTYAALKPTDVEAQLELVRLHRRAGALEPLVDLLGELWPRLDGAGRVAARREYAEGTLTLGRSGPAIEALRSILTDAPDDEWASTRLLGLLPADEAHAKERLELLSRLAGTAAGESRAELLARRAELLRRQGDLSAARADLKEAAQASANPLPLLRQLAELARDAKDEGDELAAWRLVLDKAGDDEKAREQAGERLVYLAWSRSRAGDAANALEAFEAVVGLDLPAAEQHNAWSGLANAATALGRTRRAEEALAEAAKVGPVPKRVEALLSRAALLEARGARNEAVESFEAALALAPRHPEATEGLKRNLRAQEDWAGLAEVLSTEAQGAPKSQAAPLFVELSQLYLERLKLPGPAESALRRVIALDKQNVTARRQLAALLVDKNALPEAVELLEAAAELLPPQESAGVLREGAALARKAQDLDVELRLMRRAQGLTPATGEDLRRLAEALYLHGALDEAFPLQKTLASRVSFEENPEAAEAALMRLADLAENQGDLALAESSLKRVVDERPLAWTAVERLAELVKRSNPTAALELLARHAEGLSRSPRAADRLWGLARQAWHEVGDVELSLRLFRKAAEVSEAPLEIREETVALLRSADRPAELLAELPQLAQLELTSGAVDAALTHYEEEATLAERLGRLDDALRTLKAVADIAADEGRADEAARALLKSAELLRDGKLDLAGAEAALARAWELEARPDIATAAMALAQRRGDRDAEIDWLERTFGALTEPAAKAQGFLELARLHLGLSHEGGDLATAPLNNPDQAEAALKQALELEPGLTAASDLLLGLYERQDRVGDVAAFYEEAASRETTGAARAALLLKAAELYKDRAQRPHEAAAALLAARAANPDDSALTARVADLLHEMGRVQDAADFDAVLLEADPFHSAFERHKAALEQAGDRQGVAVLLSRRAEKQTGADAAKSWMEAAQAFRAAGATERAQLCESQAFESAPENAEAFEKMLERAGDDVRRKAELYAARARALPGEASSLLHQRAAALTRAGEALLAAGAWDDYLEAVPDDLEALETRADLAADAGGPRAAQPYDRKLVQLGAATLPAPTRLKAFLRLGQAALESKAFRDAIDALENVTTLDAEGTKGREALSLLQEAYAEAHDAQGQYFTTLRLAQRSQGEESEALYRRAVNFFDDPSKAIEAIDVLLKLRPADEALYVKGVRAYAKLGRLGDLVALHERFAAAVGGASGAQALKDAAQVLETDLGEAGRAFELRQQALALTPADTDVLETVLAEQRRRGDTQGSIDSLKKLLMATAQDARANEVRLRLAALEEQTGDLTRARRTLGPVRESGAGGVGYAQALEALIRITSALEDFAGEAKVRAEAAALLPAGEKATALLDAARAWQRALDFEQALGATRASLSERTSREGYELLAELGEALKRPDVAAEALEQLAHLEEGEGRAKRLLEAAAAWEAAGNTAEVVEALETVLRDAPDLLPPEDAAKRFAKLGAHARALEVGFGPALAEGAYDRARALAEAAGDEEKVRESLWAQVEAEGLSPAVDTLKAMLGAAADVDGLKRLAAALDQAQAAGPATALWRELYLETADADALEALAARGELEETAQQALEDEAVAALVELLPHAGDLSPALREQLYLAIADEVPERARGLVRQVAELRKEDGRVEAAAEALGRLATLEEAPNARAALRVEEGELWLHQQKDPARARAAFERALVDDARQPVALRELVALAAADGGEKFISLAERLAEVAGEDALAAHHDALADAYEAAGRDKDAYRVLAQLEETPERLARRAKLAEALGLSGEALSLREKVATEASELEQILLGYLDAELVPFAVRLGTRLLDGDSLSPEARRRLAERLAPTAQGAALAIRIWPALLAKRPADADGWTLFGEALHQAERETDAAVADGFGAALTSAAQPAPRVALQQAFIPDSEELPPPPKGAVPISDATMPRLAAAIGEVLEGLGASQLDVVLDPGGGVEAWLADGPVLVLGAGALPVFGATELAYLVALALQLGERGEALLGVGEVQGLPDAAESAFAACPSSLAAGRVLAHLDARVRGGDPAGVDLGALLKDNPAYRAVALAALERLGA